MRNTSRETKIDFLLKEAGVRLKNVQADWSFIRETLDVDENDEERSQDLFSQIQFLADKDEARKRLETDISQIESIHTTLLSLDPNSFSENGVFLFNQFCLHLDILQQDLNTKAQAVDDLETARAEATLKRCITRINVLIDSIFQLRKMSSLKEALNFDLDPEMELNELRNSLEEYKATRSNLKVPPDPVLDVLESTIVECDNALLIDESSL